MNNLTKIIMFIIIVILLVYVYFLKENENSKVQEALNKQNNLAMMFKDSTEYWTSKNGQLYSKNYALMKSNDSIQDFSYTLYDEIKKLEKENKKLKVFVSVEADVQIKGFDNDSTNTEGILDDNGNGIFYWNFKKEEPSYLKILKGETHYSVKVLNNNVDIIPLKTYITEDLSEIEIILLTTFNEQDSSITITGTSKSKNVKLLNARTNIDPYRISKDVAPVYFEIPKNDIVIDYGLQVGLGVNPFRITDPNNNSFQPIFYVGFGITLDFGNIVSVNLPSWIK